MARPYALLALLALTACEDMPQARTESEMRLIARDESDAQVRQLEARILDLEDRLDEVEQLNADQAQTIARLSRFAVNDQDNIERLFENDDLWRQHITYLRWFHGQPPLPEPKK